MMKAELRHLAITSGKSAARTWQPESLARALQRCLLGVAGDPNRAHAYGMVRPTLPRAPATPRTSHATHPLQTESESLPGHPGHGPAFLNADVSSPD